MNFQSHFFRFSSDEQAKERSLTKISDLLTKNGYPARLVTGIRREALIAANGSRGRRDGRQKGRRRLGHTITGDRNGHFLTLPYVDGTILCKVKRAVKRSKMEVHLGWYTPTSLKKDLSCVHGAVSRAAYCCRNASTNQRRAVGVGRGRCVTSDCCCCCCCYC